MALLTPDSGLLFWMLVSFGIVVLVLMKFGFPIILKMIDERKAFIEESISMAEKAQLEFRQLKAESEQLMGNARKEQQAILTQAKELHKQIVMDAHLQAVAESEKIVAQSKVRIEQEKNEALHELRTEIVKLSIELTERIIQQKLASHTMQQELIDTLMNEVDYKKL